MTTAAAQSTLNPASGSPADAIDGLATLLYAGGAAIFVVVLALVVYATVAQPRAIDSRRWIVIGGLAIPVLLLAALFGYAYSIGERLHAAGEPATLRIHVEGRRWWWQVRYVSSSGGADPIVLANEIHLPAGRPAELLLTTGDVIHSFWVPSLAGKVDMIPGRENRLVIKAAEEGVFRGQCAEYCGAQHALMAFDVVVETDSEFDAWLERQGRPAQVADDESRRALEHFLKGGCAACHAIRGTAAAGSIGPDLTHVGGRRMIAAGLLRNHAGTMAGWIAGAQELKPGNLMPDTRVLSGPELRELAAWLEALE
jgi:cytochrome c oxidase subunit II